MPSSDIRSRPRSNSRSRSPPPRETRSRDDDSYSRNSDRRKRVRSQSRDRNERPPKRRSISPREENYERHSRRHRNEGDRRYRSRSRSPRRCRESPKPYQKSRVPLPSQDAAFKNGDENALAKPVEKQKPNFGTSGKLAAASNTVQIAGKKIILKYNEPPEARKPPSREPWRIYVFKGDEILETLELAHQSCWLFGREATVVDSLTEHESCSKQHAVIQFRYIEKRNEFGDKIGKVKPYIIDLESANGTFVNGDLIPTAKYVQLIDKDIVKFGHSTREYVIQLPPPR